VYKVKKVIQNYTIGASKSTIFGKSRTKKDQTRNLSPFLSIDLEFARIAEVGSCMERFGTLLEFSPGADSLCSGTLPRLIPG